MTKNENPRKRDFKKKQPFIIAEISANHNSITRTFKLIKEAKKVGNMQ